MFLQKEVQNIMDVTCKLKRKWDKRDTYLESERVEIPGAHNKESRLGGF